jgi:hypothetical protein
MRPTMQIWYRVWLWSFERILAHKSPRLGLWALAGLRFWDRHLNLRYINPQKRERE